jgi:hypothetical protein
MKVDRDKLGIFVSLACAVHCLLLPVAVVALPFLSSLQTAEWVHGIVLGLAILPAVETLIFESAFIKNWYLVLLGVTGLFLMFLSMLVHEQFHDLFLIGGLILGFAHILRLLLVSQRENLNQKEKQCRC